MEGRLDFWAGRWNAGDSPWHANNVNPFLINYFERAIAAIQHQPQDESRKCRVFVPLCGKSLDLLWIYDGGHTVVGVDGVESPILAFFTEQNLPFVKGTDSGVPFYSTEDGRLKIYHSDLFDLNTDVCGKFDIIWDRGSLVAIYPEDRMRYAALMKQLLDKKFSYLIDTMVYDQSQYSGPPRSVPVDEIKALFDDGCHVEVLEDIDRNTDPTNPRSPKIRWNVDECHEVILLLTAK